VLEIIQNMPLHFKNNDAALKMLKGILKKVRKSDPNFLQTTKLVLDNIWDIVVTPRKL